MSEMSIDMLRVYYAKHPVLDVLESAMRALGVMGARTAEMLLATAPIGAQLTSRESAALLARWYEPCEYCGRLLAWTPPPASRRGFPGYWRHLSLDVVEAVHPGSVPNRPLLGQRVPPPHDNEGRCDCAPPLDYVRAGASYHCAALGQDQPFPLSVQVEVMARTEDALGLIREQAADAVARAEESGRFEEGYKIAVRVLREIAAGRESVHPS